MNWPHITNNNTRKVLDIFLLFLRSFFLSFFFFFFNFKSSIIPLIFTFITYYYFAKKKKDDPIFLKANFIYIFFKIIFWPFFSFSFFSLTLYFWNSFFLFVLGSLVQSRYREGGTLQTNNTGVCSQCLSHTGSAPVHGACSLPADRKSVV